MVCEMSPEIYTMLELQSIWDKVLAAKNEIVRSRHAIDFWRGEMKAIEDKMADLRSRVNQLKTNIKQKELELHDVESRIQFLDSRKNSLKSQRDFDSMSTEMETLNKKKDEIENNMLQYMEDVDAIEGELSVFHKEMPKRLNQIEKDVEELQNKLEYLQKEAEDNAAQFTKQITELPPDLRARFAKVIETKGNAIVPLENGTCMGCHFQVPVYVKDEVAKSKSVACTNCGRFLYFKN